MAREQSEKEGNRGQAHVFPLQLIGAMLVFAAGVAIGGSALPMAETGDSGVAEPSEFVQCNVNWNSSTMVCFASDDVNVTINDGRNASQSGNMSLDELPMEENDGE